MRQLSIFDIDFCPLPENQPGGWKMIPEEAEIKLFPGIKDYMGDRAGDLIPDRTGKGLINGEPVIVGYLIGVSGPGECFTHNIPKYYKEDL